MQIMKYSTREYIDTLNTTLNTTRPTRTSKGRDASKWIKVNAKQIILLIILDVL